MLRTARSTEPKPNGFGARAWLLTQLLRQMLKRSLIKRRLFELEVQGQDLIPPKGMPVIIAANHPGWWDAVAVLGAINRNAAFYAKAELWRNPVLRWLLNAMGHIAVRRGDAESGQKAQASGLMVLKHNGVDVIFPEGTTTPPGGTMGDLKKGVYWLARESGAPVAVCVIEGTERVGRLYFSRLWRPGPSVRVRVRFVATMSADYYDGPEAFLTDWRAFVESAKSA